MKKRILGFVLALCLIIGLLPAIALAEEAAAANPQAVTVTLRDSVNYTAETAIKWEVEAGDKYYATTSATGVITSLGSLKKDLNNIEPAAWNIMLDNTAATAVLVLNGATIDILTSAQTGGGNALIMVAGDGALEIRTIADSTVTFQRNGGISTAMGGGTTYTGNAKLTVTNDGTKTNYATYAIRETVGTLTFKNADVYTFASYNAGSKATRHFALQAASTLTVDGGTLYVAGQHSHMGCIKASADLIIKNNANVTLRNRGTYVAAEVAGEFVIDSATLAINNSHFNSAPYMINKMPTLNGVFAKYSSEKSGSDWETLAVAAGTDLTTGEHNYWRYLFEACAHANAGTQTDCATAVICPDCNGTVAAAKEHTVVDDKDCTTADVCTVCKKVVTEAKAAHSGGKATCTAKAVCEVCGKEYGELGHEPAEGTFSCDVAHPCKLCGGTYREAGTHIGGGTAATCAKKAVCSCGAEYGELAACTPAADDGDCSTAIKCTVCGKETTAAQTHKYTNNSDTTCDNAGCTHTRKVEQGDKNPQTGDNTPVVLFVALATLAAAAVIFTKKRAII